MKKFYVIGNRVSKSLSPTIFNYWFKKYRIKAKYGFREISERSFDKEIKKILSDKNVAGINVTIPFKNKIIKYVHELDRHAKKINAVNCLSIKNQIKGDNTDWSGYYKTLPRNIKEKNKKIVMFGYGGAAQAIHYVLNKKGHKNIHIFNRSRKRLNFVNEQEYTLGKNKLKYALEDADLIINTTPINPIKKEYTRLINKKTLLSDIVYKPKETDFLKSFPFNKKIYGISMLLEQASPCFRGWIGFKPEIDQKLISILERKIS